MSSEPSALRRFLGKSIQFLLVQLLVVTGVVLFGSPKRSNHYLGAIQDKIERLQNSDGSRLVILGGSNVAFGIHSPVMQQSIGMETVNLGLHVSLGMSFPMECYLQHARRDDIVILCPEFHLLTSEKHLQGDPQTIAQLLEQWPQAKQFLPNSAASGWKEFLDRDALWLAHQWVGRAVRAVRHRDTDDKIYARSSFNEYGDVVAHYGRSSEQLMPIDSVPEIQPEAIEATIAMLNQFHQDCKQRGVRVYLSYPPLLDSLYASCEETIDELHRTLTDRVDIPLLHPPDQFAYSRDHFYDSAYHLNQQAGEARSRFLAAAIEREGVERISRSDEHPLGARPTALQQRQWASLSRISSDDEPSSPQVR